VSLPPADLPIVDEIAVKRLRQLRDQVAKPGEDVLGELLGLFERDARVRVDAIRAAVALGTGALGTGAAAAEARRQAAHALKGAAGNIGAARVAATAGHVEKNEIDEAVVDLLRDEVEAALQALRSRLA
jgi:HPt (histidine-containing phosphotransfer) domain-containing protein